MTKYSEYSNVDSATTSAGYPAVLEDGNTVGWYDFDDMTTITKDGSDKVSLWKDKLLSGNDLAQVTSGNQPLWTASGVAFTIANTTYMRTPIIVSLVQPETIYIVFKQVDWGANRYIFDGYNSNTAYLNQLGTTPDLTLVAGNPAPVNNDMVLDTFGIMRVVINGANSSLQVNLNSADVGNSGTNGSSGFTLGGRVGSRFSNIVVKEVVLRKVADSAGDQTAIYNYLKTANGL